MAIDKIDFHSIFTTEGVDLYSGISKFDPDDFNNWVSSTFNEIATITSLSQICPDKSIIIELEEAGYFHREGQCHYSAKAVCLLTENVDCYTGFVVRNDSYCEIITHSFNYYNSQIIDLSRLDSDYYTLVGLGITLPHTYFGVKLPKNFLQKYRDAVLIHHSMNPLLLEWYMECTNTIIK